MSTGDYWDYMAIDLKCILFRDDRSFLVIIIETSSIKESLEIFTDEAGTKLKWNHLNKITA